MLFTILKPYDPPKKINILWLEVDTSAGSFVLQKGHAPLILALKNNSEIHYERESGLKETLIVQRAILKINRQEVKLITQ